MVKNIKSKKYKQKLENKTEQIKKTSLYSNNIWEYIRWMGTNLSKPKQIYDHSKRFLKNNVLVKNLKLPINCKPSELELK